MGREQPRPGQHWRYCHECNRRKLHPTTIINHRRQRRLHHLWLLTHTLLNLSNQKKRYDTPVYYCLCSFLSVFFLSLSLSLSLSPPLFTLLVGERQIDENLICSLLVYYSYSYTIKKKGIHQHLCDVSNYYSHHSGRVVGHTYTRVSYTVCRCSCMYQNKEKNAVV